MTPAAPTIRRFRPDDAAATRAVFYQAVRIGAAGYYTETELADWAKTEDVPDYWGSWLDEHITFVSETTEITGFMMLEASGYLNMAFVLPDFRRAGHADLLHAAILTEGKTLGLTRLTVLASRMAERFFARHGWVQAPGLRDAMKASPMNAPMILDLINPNPVPQ